MIKINKLNTVPDILRTNGQNWTDELLEEIEKYGSYSNLPEAVKKKVSERYKHSDIKSSLIPNDDTKCAFCESIPNESGYVEIEHYLPKSLYPQETYSWHNLLPSCKRCNLKKLALDTGQLPIVKPDYENPDDYFSYNNIKIVVKENSINEEKAQRTINKLKLNEYRLINPRSKLLVSLVEYECNLEETLHELASSKNANKKNRILSNILESLDKIDELTKDESKFSGFCRNYIQNSMTIQEARRKAEEL